MRYPKMNGKDEFLFLGNHLALDFINTRPVQNGKTTELLPDFEALLRWFVAAGLLSPGDMARFRRKWGPSVRARRTVEAVRELREKLRKQVIAWERGEAVQRSSVRQLNRLMAQHPMRNKLKSGRNPSMEQWFELQQPEDLHAPLAYSAATLFTYADRRRVRKCAQCVGHFHDTSKKGTRRWCSMRLCGNRLKVAAYAARRRGKAPHPATNP
jgi:predicted RNA-binding Zn ribbon-like protein